MCVAGPPGIAISHQEPPVTNGACGQVSSECDYCTDERKFEIAWPSGQGWTYAYLCDHHADLTWAKTARLRKHGATIKQIAPVNVTRFITQLRQRGTN